MLSKAYWSRFKDTSADRLQAIAHALGRADGHWLPESIKVYRGSYTSPDNT